MRPDANRPCTAFDHHRLLASGPLAEVALAARRALDAGAAGSLLVLDDASGLPVEIDFRGTPDEMLARLQGASLETIPRGPGRPKLGVVSREVTLLPRHWDWLAQQPDGASAVLRRLVEQAARGGDAKGRARQAAEAADRSMRVLAGDLAGYEEAARAFWRGERAGFIRLTDHWPADVRDHLRRLAALAWDAQAEAD
ncbi:hypothetical protein RHOFW510R12_05265 [Rhodanobacter sp. FW510-R12]|uniref:DUF2239 family protein n=1 Tax=unclassified Rhodanobacter TaxID=2621553 RepID=UPI0007AA2D63|nr:MULTISPECIES: DUF2239 family protein [unclassified Rhodanobacter]KZC17816.1 hypothetical protein RHOFW104R8_09345 [Rhodanobacter sp. FW104-R8]KZC27180.1 hypothetical protein RhoFW510T8_15825 [Rhodanobacter sp. FW510-T8]KZC31618.1 hypothetical protein RhoFW510R10_15770 [Rhodanobacter sp. FW510-R10]